MHHAWNLQSLQQSQQGHVGQGVCSAWKPRISDHRYRRTPTRPGGLVPLCGIGGYYAPVLPSSVPPGWSMTAPAGRSRSTWPPGLTGADRSQDQELQAELCRRVGGGFLHLGHYSGNIGIVLQRRFKEGCLRVREGERGAWHGTGWRVRCDVVYPPATTATPKVRTAPKAASHAPPDTPAPW